MTHQYAPALYGLPFCLVCCSFSIKAALLLAILASFDVRYACHWTLRACAVLTLLIYSSVNVPTKRFSSFNTDVFAPSLDSSTASATELFTVLSPHFHVLDSFQILLFMDS